MILTCALTRDQNRNFETLAYWGDALINWATSHGPNSNTCEYIPQQPQSTLALVCIYIHICMSTHTYTYIPGVLVSLPFSNIAIYQIHIWISTLCYYLSIIYSYIYCMHRDIDVTCRAFAPQISASSWAYGPHNYMYPYVLY